MNRTEPSKEVKNSGAFKSQRDLQRQILHDRIAGVAASMVDVAERIVEQLRAPQTLPAPPLQVARRQLANTLKLAQFCANSRCRRARCCRGEPLHCLAVALPLMPPELVARLALHERRTRRGRPSRGL